MPGAVTISIDLELAWGNWDNLAEHHIRHVEASERPIVRRLVDLLDRHELPVTWAFVAALLDASSARAQPGPEHLWYAPDVIDTIRSANVAHELGSHGGRHRYLDLMSEPDAEADLGFAAEVHRSHGLPFRSFVFPRNRVARTELLARYGIGVYRGEDHAWHQRIRSRQPAAGRIANLIDKMLPIAPETVRPEREGALVNLPGSLLFLGRDGVRKMAAPAVIRAKLNKGLERAARDGGVFHLWFHPSNFWHETDTQFAIFEDFAARAARMAKEGSLEVRTMGSFA